MNAADEYRPVNGTHDELNPTGLFFLRNLADSLVIDGGTHEPNRDEALLILRKVVADKKNITRRLAADLARETRHVGEQLSLATTRLLVCGVCHHRGEVTR